jgi:hypothetical protein
MCLLSFRARTMLFRSRYRTIINSLSLNSLQNGQTLFMLFASLANHYRLLFDSSGMDGKCNEQNDNRLEYHKSRVPLFTDLPHNPTAIFAHCLYSSCREGGTPSLGLCARPNLVETAAAHGSSFFILGLWRCRRVNIIVVKYV